MPRTAIAEISPLQHETVQNRVYTELRRMLMIGRFRPGQAMKLQELTNAFGTSTQPVREALRQLVTEKALESLPNRSARVPEADTSRLADLRLARLTVEGLAVELAAQRITPAEIETLEQIIAAQADADLRHDAEASVGQNLVFHFTLYGYSGSRVLVPLIESLWLQLGPYMRSARERFNPASGTGGMFHRRTVEALRQRDSGRARAAIEGDISRTFEILAS